MLAFFKHSLHASKTPIVYFLLIVALTPEALGADPPVSQAGADRQDPKPTVSEPYIDQVLDERPLKDVELELEEDLGPLGEGRRFLSTEYRMFYRDNTVAGSATEHGVGLLWDQETIDYGFLSLDASLRGITGEREEQASFGERVSLRQDQFALTNDLLMDNELGDYLSLTDPLISASYRFHLPSSHLRGLQTRIYGDQGKLSLAAGQVGNLEGTFTQTFDRFGGSMFGLGYTRPLLGDWSAGAQTWHVNGVPNVHDHTSFAGLLQHEAPDLRQRYQLHSLYETTGNWGLWFDGDNFIGPWRHRYGLFRFQPDLLWTDVQIVNDLQGLYWRADERNLLRSWSAGLDLSESNIEALPTRAGRINVSGYLSGQWRLLNKTAAGGILSAGLQREGEGLPTDESEFYRLTGNISREFPLGISRVQSTVGRVESAANPSWEYGAVWDHEWAVARDNRLSHTVSWERRDEGGDMTTRILAAVTANRDLTPNLYLNSSAVYVNTDGDSAGAGQDINLSFGLSWEPIANWQLTLLGLWTRNTIEPPAAERTSVEDLRFFLTLRRAVATGSPAVVFGAAAGQAGSGRVIGRVFFDENRDGRWNPNEKGMGGLAVFLDGRFPGETDERGGFEFWPVSAGEHRLSVGLENVPLPWGLDDETARRFEVEVRGDTEVDFPLVKVRE